MPCTLTHLYELGDQVRVVKVVRSADRQQDEGHQMNETRVIESPWIVPSGRGVGDITRLRYGLRALGRTGS